MLGDVVQAFLGYPIEAQGEIEGNRLRHAAMRELELDGMEFREVGAVGFKRSHQSEMLQGRRVELVRRAAQVVRELFDALAQGSELVADGLGRTRQVPFQQAHLVCQHGHPLVHVVVKFPRQAAALLVLHLQEPAGELTQRLFRLQAGNRIASLGNNGLQRVAGESRHYTQGTRGDIQTTDHLTFMTHWNDSDGMQAFTPFSFTQGDPQSRVFGIDGLACHDELRMG